MSSIHVLPTMSLVMPLYNEAEGIGQIVEALVTTLQREVIPFQVVLVNNGSIDGTGAVLDALSTRHTGVTVATVPINQGYGWGILSGLDVATGDIVGFMCADGQIAAEDIVRVYRRIVVGDVDLAKVVRVSREDGLQRRVMSAVYNRLFRALFGLALRDINGTPKLVWRKTYRALTLTSKDWFIDAELMIQAAQRRLRVGEVEVNFLARNHGSSNVRLTTSLEFLGNMLRHRLRPRARP